MHTYVEQDTPLKKMVQDFPNIWCPSSCNHDMLKPFSNIFGGKLLPKDVKRLNQDSQFRQYWLNHVLELLQKSHHYMVQR